MTAALLRPIEIVAGTNDNFTAAGNVKTISPGLYHNILTLLAEIEDLIQTEYANITVRLDTDHKVKFIKSDAADGLLTAFDDPLILLLGEDDNTNAITVPASSSITMDLTPEYCWIPTYARASRHRFTLKQDTAFAGQVPQNGRTTGISTGPDRSHIRIKWENQSAASTALSGEQESFPLNGVTYYPNQRRCWEYFIQQARTVMPVVSTTPTPKGFYYLPCIDNYEGDVPTWNIPDAMTSYNGTMLDWTGTTCNPIHRYCYCHLEPPGAPDPSDTQEVGSDHYTVDLICHDADLPTFDGPP